MRKLAIYFFILVWMVESSVAVGIISSGDNIIIDFKPNLEQTLTFGVRSNMAAGMDVSLGIGGEMSKYAILSESSLFLEPGETKYFTVTVKLPGEVEVMPGDHQIRVSAVESPSGEGIATRGAVSTYFIIRVPYPGIYARVGFDVSDVNVNETVDFRVTIRNLGTEDLTNAHGTIEVYDGSESLLKTLDIEQTEVKGQTSKEIVKTMPTTGVKPGPYKAVATVFYFTNKTILEKGFRIGSLEARIINYTKEFEKDKINKFDIVVESGWNDAISDIYADISIKGGNGKIASLRTPNTELNPWERETLFTYWDTAAVEEGEYDAVITLGYSGQTTTESGKVSVFEKKKKFLEVPKFFNATTILVLLLILLILGDLLWFLRKKRKGK